MHPTCKLANVTAQMSVISMIFLSYIYMYLRYLFLRKTVRHLISSDYSRIGKWFDRIFVLASSVSREDAIRAHLFNLLAGHLGFLAKRIHC